ncbi:MAG: SagB/ThcOx family dehydrogenase [Egibacteraceae bacterium]
MKIAATIEDGKVPVLLPEDLARALQGLSAEEQSILLAQIRRGREGNPRADAFSVFRESLKFRADRTNPLLDNYEELSTVKAPPVLKEYPGAEKVELPRDFLPLDASLEQVLEARASRRDYARIPVSLQELSTLLHYAYGVRKHMVAYNVRHFPMRYCPSAGGLQSAEVYLVANQVEGLRKGLWHYYPARHQLELLSEGNMRRKVVDACMYAEFLHYPGLVLILTGVMSRLRWKYGLRAYRYAHVDAGFVGENLYLVATALRLRVCAVAGFFDDRVDELLDIDGQDEFTVLLMAVGKRPQRS